MQKIVLASGNAGKLIELQQILAQKEISLLPQAEFAIGDVEETGLKNRQFARPEVALAL